MDANVANQTPIYEEFEPFCRWQLTDDRDILEIHLQDFKKQELKVQVSNLGVLKIVGERSIEAKSTHSKFYKEVPLPSNKYDTNAIHAKFVNSMLIITLPKMKTSVPPEINEKVSPPEINEKVSPPEINEKVSPPESSKSDQTPKPKPTVEPPNIGGEANEQTPTTSAKCRLEDRKRAAMGERMAKVAVTLAATAALVAVLVAYVAYMYKSTVGEIDD